MVPPPDAPAPKILIVDDQLSNVRLLDQTLRRAGFTDVTAVTEPRNVAALHLEHRYDLILLDLQMPGLNGFEVLAQLQTVKAANPVAVLVLSADASQTKAVLAAGADSFLGKPFKLPEVVERVQKMLREHPPS
ncbi:MAG TPA: response regulator [Thermoanaerobaculia bacterium]|jgi:CheY-like chemotaxis protein